MQWYVVATRPQMELAARVNLERQGYSVLLPQISIRKRRRGKWAMVIEPLFPGYIFVELEFGNDDPAPIRSTVGCRGLVRFGHEYVPVPSAVIAPLLSVGEEPVTEENKFKLGDQVRLETGPFAGFSAVFEMTKGSDRARVLIELLGKPRPVLVGLDDISDQV